MKYFLAPSASKFWTVTTSRFMGNFGLGHACTCSGLSLGSDTSCGQGPKPVTTSGLHPTSMRVSGHSQLPVAGLKASPGSQGIPVAVTKEHTPEGITEGIGGSGRKSAGGTKPGAGGKGERIFGGSTPDPPSAATN